MQDSTAIVLQTNIITHEAQDSWAQTPRASRQRADMQESQRSSGIATAAGLILTLVAVTMLILGPCLFMRGSP